MEGWDWRNVWFHLNQSQNTRRVRGTEKLSSVCPEEDSLIDLRMLWEQHRSIMWGLRGTQTLVTIMIIHSGSRGSCGMFLLVPGWCRSVNPWKRRQQRVRTYSQQHSLKTEAAGYSQVEIRAPLYLLDSSLGSTPGSGSPSK